jgi:hypothetical protein
LTILRYRLLVSLVPRRCVATPITAWFDCSTADNTPQIFAQFLFNAAWRRWRDCRNKFTLRIFRPKPTIVSTKRVSSTCLLAKVLEDTVHFFGFYYLLEEPSADRFTRVISCHQHVFPV